MVGPSAAAMRCTAPGGTVTAARVSMIPLGRFICCSPSPVRQPPLSSTVHSQTMQNSQEKPTTTSDLKVRTRLNRWSTAASRGCVRDCAPPPRTDRPAFSGRLALSRFLCTPHASRSPASSETREKAKEKAQTEHRAGGDSLCGLSQGGTRSAGLAPHEVRSHPARAPRETLSRIGCHGRPSRTATLHFSMSVAGRLLLRV